MKATAKFIFCIFFLVIPSVGFSAVNCSNNQNPYLFFINGMKNSFEQAMDSFEELSNRLVIARTFGGVDIANGENIRLELSYNHLEAFWVELYQVIKQKLIEEETWSKIEEFNQGKNSIPQADQEQIAKLMATYANKNWIKDADLRLMLDRYKELIDTGHKIIVVSHSQGNFYANEVYALIDKNDNNSVTTRKNNYGIVSVGTPTDQVFGNGDYYTLEKDKVMNFTRFIYPSTLAGLESNSDYTPTAPNFLYHSFIEAYLNGDVTRNKIINSIARTFARLEQPLATLDSGIITIRLGWGSQPDLDLHVYEPNGTHVYWLNKQGISGFLDKDDVNGYGPEHYRVKCENLESGTYKIGINYYRGTTSETATIHIAAGDKTTAGNFVFNSAVGSNGDNSPIPVADIIVSGDSVNGYDFSIQNIFPFDIIPFQM